MTVQAQKLVASNVSVIAVSISLKPPVVSFVGTTPQAVYFIKLDKNGDSIRGLNPISSNFRDGDDFYLLNTQPGRYVAISAMYSKQPRNTTSSIPVGTSSAFTISIAKKISMASLFNNKIAFIKSP